MRFRILILITLMFQVPNLATAQIEPADSVSRTFVSVSTRPEALNAARASVAEYEFAEQASDALDHLVQEAANEMAQNDMSSIFPVAIGNLGDETMAFDGTISSEGRSVPVAVLGVRQDSLVYVFSGLTFDASRAPLEALVGVAERTLGLEDPEFESVPGIPYENGGLWDLLPRLEHMPGGMRWYADGVSEAASDVSQTPPVSVRIEESTIPVVKSSGPAVNPEGLTASPPPVTQGSVDGPYLGATLGDPNAPVTLIIYADYQCHFCREFHEESYPQIVDDFVRAGHVKIEFREFPALGEGELTDDGNESAQAAEAALCAGEQESYLEYHDTLYANFNGVNQGGFNSDRLRGFADDLGLDTEAFNECLESERYEPYVIQSIQEGRALGINATPMFLIDNGNGKPNIIQMTSAGYDLLRRQIETSIETAAK